MPDESTSLRERTLEKVREWHAGNKTFTGRRTMHSFPSLEALCGAYRPETLLDYGCGKGVQWSNRDIEFLGRVLPSLGEALGGVRPTLYDPGVPEYEIAPVGLFDCAIAVDVLEYVPEPDLPRVLAEIFGHASAFVYFHTSVTRPAKDCTPDEPWNRTAPWWVSQFVRAADACPGVDWYARIKRPDGFRDLWAGRGRPGQSGQSLALGLGQFELSHVQAVRALCPAGLRELAKQQGGCDVPDLPGP